MSAHNLCFGAKLRKISVPLQTPVFFINVGFKRYTSHGNVTCPDGIYGISCMIRPCLINIKRIQLQDRIWLLVQIFFCKN